MPNPQQPPPTTDVIPFDMRRPIGDPPTLALVLRQSKGRLAGLTDKQFTMERVAQLAMAAARRSPGLLECTAESVVDAVVRATELRLDFTGVTGGAYLVPFKDRGVKKSQLIIGYRGMIDLCTRSRRVLSVQSRAVFSKERFQLRYGTSDRIVHHPFLGDDRGEFVGVYAVAKMPGGVTQFDFMSAADVEETKRRSRAKEDGPWQTDFIEMAKKTVVRRLSKNLPISIDNEDYDGPTPAEGEAAEAGTSVAIQSLNDLPEAPAAAAALPDFVDAEVVERKPADRPDRTGRKAAVAPPAAAVGPASPGQGPGDSAPAPQAPGGPAAPATAEARDPWAAFEAEMWELAGKAGATDAVRANAVAVIGADETDDAGKAISPARLAELLVAMRDGRFDWVAVEVQQPAASPASAAPPDLADDKAFRAAWDAASAKLTLDPGLGWNVALTMLRRRKLALGSARPDARRAMLDEYAAWTPEKVQQVKDKAEENRRKADAEKAAKSAPPEPAQPEAAKPMDRTAFEEAMAAVADAAGVPANIADQGIKAWENAAPLPPEFIEAADFDSCLASARSGHFNWDTGEEMQ